MHNKLFTVSKCTAYKKTITEYSRSGELSQCLPSGLRRGLGLGLQLGLGLGLGLQLGLGLGLRLQLGLGLGLQLGLGLGLQLGLGLGLQLGLGLGLRVIAIRSCYQMNRNQTRDQDDQEIQFLHKIDQDAAMLPPSKFHSSSML